MARTSEAQIIYTPRPDATPAAELSVLAQVYKFVLESRKAGEPAPEPDGRDGTKAKGDSANVSIVPH
jgi:hypothetical protein